MGGRLVYATQFPGPVPWSTGSEPSGAANRGIAHFPLQTPNAPYLIPHSLHPTPHSELPTPHTPHIGSLIDSRADLDQQAERVAYHGDGLSPRFDGGLGHADSAVRQGALVG